MKLKFKILLITLAITISLGAVFTVIMEYVLSLNTKNEIILAEREEQRKREEEEAKRKEDEYIEENRMNLLNSYDKVEDYYNGLALVKRGDKYGYIDINGKEVISLEYDIANNFTNRNYSNLL